MAYVPNEVTDIRLVLKLYFAYTKDGVDKSDDQETKDRGSTFCFVG